MPQNTFLCEQRNVADLAVNSSMILLVVPKFAFDTGVH